jgi:hypothetical protein
MANQPKTDPLKAAGCIVVFTVLTIAGVLAPRGEVFGSSAVPTSVGAGAVTFDRYDSLRPGMSEAEVESWLGVKGVEESSSRLMESDYKNVRYSDGRIVVFVTYENGRMYQKSQSGF